MPIPTTGPVSFSDINIELQKSSTTTLSMGDSDLRTLFEDTDGDISISTGRGKSWIVTGSSDYTTAGSYTWLSPARGWNTLTVQVWGGGGGGGGTTRGRPDSFFSGGTGGQSSFIGSVIANGGNPGNGYYLDAGTGTGGTATGGDSNFTGGARNGISGGSSPSATAVGHGNGGSGNSTGQTSGGGAGGYAVKSYTGYSVLAKNTGYTVVVGAEGTAGGGVYPGNPGIRGRVFISWS